MVRMGITGSIGSGKTEVCRRLREWGYAVLDADEVARKITESDQAVRGRLRERFGEAYFDDDGQLKRRELGRLVFSNPEALRDLNAIVHPAMIRRIETDLAELEQSGCPVAFVEAAVLFEARMEHLFDLVVVVAADLETAIRRTAQRLGISEEEAWERYRAQIPVEEKIRRADYVIRNDGSLADLERAVREFLAWLKVRFPNIPPPSRRETDANER